MLSVQQFAQQSGLHPVTVREMARTGVLPATQYRKSGKWSFDPALLTKRWVKPGGYLKQHSRASIIIATIARGSMPSALRQYRNLPADLRARVDAWCAKKGIDSPGLKLKQMQVKRPAVVLDMTPLDSD